MSSIKSLTTRQQEVFDLIKRHIESTGMPPTRVEISKELGFRSRMRAEEHLKAFARKGVIEIVSVYPGYQAINGYRRTGK